MRGHEIPKPYVCAWEGCAEAFAKHNQLRKHMCGHTGERPHPCTVEGCTSAFQWPFQLRKHVQVVHESMFAYFIRPISNIYNLFQENHRSSVDIPDALRRLIRLLSFRRTSTPSTLHLRALHAIWCVKVRGIFESTWRPIKKAARCIRVPSVAASLQRFVFILIILDHAPFEAHQPCGAAEIECEDSHSR